jgi:hypothetical protein
MKNTQRKKNHVRIFFFISLLTFPSGVIKVVLGGRQLSSGKGGIVMRHELFYLRIKGERL